ncbi:MAG TPA: glycosyltransferase family 39 protein [Acidiferrobacterales bacterium]|nr:glycosyltransferase family 39 protein [Acidiferrobacterales bacterium]
MAKPARTSPCPVSGIVPATTPLAPMGRILSGGCAPAGARAQRLALWLILGSGLLHLGYSGFVGLSGDEAYYWQWSRQLDWGYYDHPPMVAWLIALGTQLFGSNEFGVRAATVLMSTGILWFVYRMAVYAATHLLPASEGGPAPASAGLWAVAAVAVTPLFGMGGFLATPDIPMVFFWALSVVLALSAVADPRPRHWLLLGLTLGLGILGKYSMAVLPLALVIAFVATRRGRELLRTPGPYLTAATAIMVCLPHVAWLAQHDFVSVFFQLGHGLGGGSRESLLRLRTLAQYLAQQAGVLSPLLFLLYLAVLPRGVGLLRQRTSGARADVRLALWVLILPGVLTLLLFAAASLFAKPLANWPAAAYVTLSVLVGVAAARCVAATGMRKHLVYAAVGFAAFVTIYAHVEAVFPITPLASSVFDKVQEKRGLAQWLQAQREAQGRNGLAAPVLADNYRLASLLAFYLPDRPRTDAPFERGSGEQYTLWRRAAPEGMAWYLTRFENDIHVSRLFREYRSAGIYIEQRAGVTTGKQYVYYGRLQRAQPSD